MTKNDRDRESSTIGSDNHLDFISKSSIDHHALTSRQSLNHVFQHSPIGMTIVDLEGRFLKTNPSFCQALGYDAEDLLTRPFSDITYPGDIPLLRTLGQQLLDGDCNDFQVETRHWNQSGTPLYVELTVTMVRDHHARPICFLLQVINLTGQKWITSELSYDAFTDSLTGLANRALLMNRLEHTLHRLERKPNSQCAVLFLDIDRFKSINHSLGHTVGDQLLCHLGHRINVCIRCNDTLARLGGDEYAILLESIDSLENALRICERIHEHLKLPFSIENYDIHASVSIGLAASKMGYTTAQDLLKKADTALHHAKLQGNISYVVFNPTLHQQAVNQWQMATQAQFAIERNELSVHYQPVICIQKRQVIGVEALVRWHHPQHGFISPGDFIPVMEATGSIIQMGYWVLKMACEQVCKWQQQLRAYQKLKLNVNISVRQLRKDDFVHEVASILKDTRLSPGDLQLEITETGIMDNAGNALKLLKELKALNVRLCMDDFGTGYSSLSRLQEMPIDVLKIDRSFIKRIDKSSETASIIRSIVDLGERLGIEIVAEGVETKTQLKKLQEMGCNKIQGFYFAKPMPPDAALRFIQDFNH